MFWRQRREEEEEEEEEGGAAKWSNKKRGLEMGQVNGEGWKADEGRKETSGKMQGRVVGCGVGAGVREME